MLRRRLVAPVQRRVLAGILFCAITFAVALPSGVLPARAAQPTPGRCDDHDPPAQPCSVPVQATPSAAPGDAYENNYDLAHAAALAWGVSYDLDLVCPEGRVDACPSGDHDFFRVMLKRGVPFLALTYDLGPGTDTTLALYLPAPGMRDPSTGLDGWQLAQGNDDVQPGGATLRSQVMLTPTFDGEALLVVASSERRNPPVLPAASGPPGRYRLIVGSPALPAIQRVLEAGTQPGVVSQPSAPGPTPVAAPATSVPPAAPTILATAQVGQSSDAEEIIHESCITGLAVVVHPEGARFSAAAMPGDDDRILMLFPTGSRVELLGSCYLGWVKVLPEAGVTPGWMFAPDLRLEVRSPSASPTPASDETTPEVVLEATPARMPKITTLPPRQRAAPARMPRIALALDVEIVDQRRRPRAGMRVQLVDLHGRALQEAATDEAGQAHFTADVPATATVWVQLPAAGITAPIDRDDPRLAFVIPDE